MRRILTLGAIALSAGIAAPAQAHVFRAGRAMFSAHSLAVPEASCPAGVPVQPVTVINQAGAQRYALARVEAAIVDQSIQLHAAWGTPCVQFGPGGWPLYLQVGNVLTGPHGQHFGGPDVTTPYAIVWTSGGTWLSWSTMFSHEIVEMLVDPQTTLGVYHDGTGSTVEVADPVESEAYRLDGVYVSDFVLPTWYAGGMERAACDGSGCMYSDPVPGSSAGGPYDEMHRLTGPWQEG